VPCGPVEPLDGQERSREAPFIGTGGAAPSGMCHAGSGIAGTVGSKATLRENAGGGLTGLCDMPPGLLGIDTKHGNLYTDGIKHSTGGLNMQGEPRPPGKRQV
jgi:hypothetical protein